MYTILLLLGLTACRPEEPVSPPVFLHRPDTVRAGKADSIVLRLPPTGQQWDYILLGPWQPLRLKPLICRDRLILPLDEGYGFVQGPATLVCAHGKTRFFYPLAQIVEPAPAAHGISSEYRSPKTVNPDSNLVQQRLLFDMDRSRNILPFHRFDRRHMASRYFYTDSIRLSPKVRTIVVQPPANITAVYVEAGTVCGIHLQGSYVDSTRIFRVITNDLRDRYGNRVTDGTMVDFYFREMADSLFHVMEAPVWQGRAHILLPPGAGPAVLVYARIGDKRSNPLKLLSRS